MPPVVEVGAPVPEAPPSEPAAPLAINRLVDSVNALRRELAERDAITSRELRSVLDALARMEANYKLLIGEFDSLRRGHIDHEERIARLESSTFRNPLPKVAAKVVRRKRK